ncbi:MAG: ABC transporter ATP-binding protein [Tissierellia bacterium]|nr:ABC transporter ATP-binding protein [Tissierellia bacterium]
MKLEIQGLVKSFGQKEVLKDIRYIFEEGKIYSIIGRNGAGKTTLFNCINQDEEFQQGKIYLVDEAGSRRPLRFEDVGMVSASPILPEFLTGQEFISYFLKLNSSVKDGEKKHVEEYFDFVKIQEKDRHKLIKYYSYGMQNKLQLLCALIRNPKVLLLDEPLSSFDIVVSHDIKEQLMAMKGEHITLMSTHILQLATDISDEIVLLRNGKLSGAEDVQLGSGEFEEYIMKALEEDLS